MDERSAQSLVVGLAQKRLRVENDGAAFWRDDQRCRALGQATSDDVAAALDVLGVPYRMARVRRHSMRAESYSRVLFRGPLIAAEDLDALARWAPAAAVKAQETHARRIPKRQDVPTYE